MSRKKEGKVPPESGGFALAILGGPGCFVFWMDGMGRAKHVEIMIDNDLLVGASGGGSSTQTVADAAASD